MDWRLSPGEAHLEDVLIRKGITKPVFDRIVVGGGAKALADPESSVKKDFLIEQIATAVNFHNIENIIIINHTDCLAYGGSVVHAASEAEEDFHIQQLELAAKEIAIKFPLLKVKKYLARLSKNKKGWDLYLKTI